ncbi:hypothetical protein ES703_111901 [subsurface metagenome]
MYPSKCLLSADQIRLLQKVSVIKLRHKLIGCLPHTSDYLFDLSAGQPFASGINPAAKILGRLRMFLIEYHKLRIGQLQLMFVHSNLARRYYYLAGF